MNAKLLVIVFVGVVLVGAAAYFLSQPKPSGKAWMKEGVVIPGGYCDPEVAIERAGEVETQDEKKIRKSL